jgi:hypothetical protein
LDLNIPRSTSTGVLLVDLLSALEASVGIDPLPLGFAVFVHCPDRRDFRKSFFVAVNNRVVND